MEITFISQMGKRKITKGTQGLDKKNLFHQPYHQNC